MANMTHRASKNDSLLKTNDVVTLEGTLVRTTDKAYLFRYCDSESNNPKAVREAWFPKSKAKAEEDDDGNATLETNQWMMSQKRADYKD